MANTTAPSPTHLQTETAFLKIVLLQQLNSETTGCLAQEMKK